MKKENDFYTVPEIANELGVVDISVYRWIKSWKLKAMRPWNRYLIMKEDYDSFIEESKN